MTLLQFVDLGNQRTAVTRHHKNAKKHLTRKRFRGMNARVMENLNLGLLLGALLLRRAAVEV